MKAVKPFWLMQLMNSLRRWVGVMLVTLKRLVGCFGQVCFLANHVRFIFFVWLFYWVSEGLMNWATVFAHCGQCMW